MQYGITLPNLGVGSDPHTAVGLAQAAEAAGWDGVFYWDAVYIPNEGATYDPWIVLTAIAAATTRVRIGPLLTPLTRRRPWKLARETATLDHLSGGRLILPVGLGALDDGGFGRVGEATDRKIRAQRLDEGLAILAGLWSGRPFSYSGEHYQLEEMTFLPPPVQQPRIPVWVVGAWPRPKSMDRAAQWDGVLPTKIADDGSFSELTPADLRAVTAYIAERRQATTPFDIVMEGETPGDDPAGASALVQPLAEAGLTWWLENVWNTPRTTGGIDGMRRRIEQGPPT